MKMSPEVVSYMKNKRILITGGTGSLGSRLATLLLRETAVATVVIFSRDEYKQFMLKERFTEDERQRLRFFIGDVRDAPRVRRAMVDVNAVIHAAAVKQVDTAEYNPDECIKTNVNGAQNVIDACIEEGVQDVVALSTDKACAPINLYGATKLVSDKLFCAANNIKGRHQIKFSVVRYGNVMGSRGSVIPFFLSRRADGLLPVTDRHMTRFNISLDEGVELVLYALTHHLGGEVFVPKIPSYRIMDVVEAVAPGAEITDIGVRPGEKLHEEMITATDSLSTIDIGPYYAILPSVSRLHQKEAFLTHHGGEMVAPGFSYNSGQNDEWETIESLREKTRLHVDPNFTV